jgi:hypothetical protein
MPLQYLLEASNLACIFAAHLMHAHSFSIPRINSVSPPCTVSSLPDGERLVNGAREVSIYMIN